MRKHRLILMSAFLSFVGAELFSESVMAVTVYDAQISIAAAAVPSTAYNTAGQFSLGSYSTASTPSSFTLFNAFSDNLGGTTGLDYLNNTGLGGDPNIIFNDTLLPVNLGTFVSVPNVIDVGPFQGPQAIRFTAPSTGTYQIASNFTDIQNVNSAPTAEIFVNNTLLSSGTAVPVTGFTYANAGLALNAGDTVDFVTDSLGNAHNATTSVSATLTLNSVPEPASLVLFALGAVGLFVVARRCRVA